MINAEWESLRRETAEGTCFKDILKSYTKVQAKVLSGHNSVHLGN